MGLNCETVLARVQVLHAARRDAPPLCFQGLVPTSEEFRTSGTQSATRDVSAECVTEVFLLPGQSSDLLRHRMLARMYPQSVLPGPCTCLGGVQNIWDPIGQQEYTCRVCHCGLKPGCVQFRTSGTHLDSWDASLDYGPGALCSDSQSLNSQGTLPDE